MYKLLISTYTILSFNLKISLDENGSFINASTRANGSVAAGATGIQAVAGEILQNPLAAASLIQDSRNLESSIQNLQNIVNQLSLDSARNTILSRSGTNSILLAQGNIRKVWEGNINSHDVSIEARGNLGKAMDLGNLGNEFFNNSNPTRMDTLGILNNIDVTDYAKTFNTVVNGNGNDLSASAKQSSSQLIDAINAVNIQRDKMSSILSNISGTSTVLAQQKAAYDALNSTLQALSDAVKANTEATKNISLDKINAVYLNPYGATAIGTGTSAQSALAAAINNISSTDANQNKTTLQNLLKNSVTVLTNNVTNAQDAAQTIDGIINGGTAKDNAGKVLAVKYTTTGTDANANTGTKTYTASTVSSDTIKDAQGNAVKSLKQAVADVQAANKAVDDAVLQAAINANVANGAAAAAAAANSRKNSTPTILPTAKAGLIAFFGKHQSVSVEYQYYFRNTNPSFTSGEVTLNYAYYFGGK
ncbi:hypothetical protein BKH43_07995 [Helicobacter sp. 13S00401-1]|nr:hypothetical protein BKH43_07995 [Helicobacter sp. 13S00401-1]